MKEYAIKLCTIVQLVITGVQGMRVDAPKYT